MSHIRMGKGQPEVMHLPADSLLSEPVTVGDRLDLRWVQREEIVNIEDTKFVSISQVSSNSEQHWV